MRLKVCVINYRYFAEVANWYSGHRNAVRLLAEQSQRETQRQELLAQRNALQQGQKVLLDLENKKYGDDASSQTSSAGTVSGSSDSFGIPTPQPEEMDEM